MLVLILIYTFLFISNILTHAFQNNSSLFAARLYLNIWHESYLNEATMQHLLLSVTGLLVDFTLNCMLSKIVYIKETVYPKTQHTICRIKIHLEQQWTSVNNKNYVDRWVRSPGKWSNMSCSVLGWTVPLALSPATLSAVVTGWWCRQSCPWWSVESYLYLRCSGLRICGVSLAAMGR